MDTFAELKHAIREAEPVHIGVKMQSEPNKNTTHSHILDVSELTECYEHHLMRDAMYRAVLTAQYSPKSGLGADRLEMGAVFIPNEAQVGTFGEAWDRYSSAFCDLPLTLHGHVHLTAKGTFEPSAVDEPRGTYTFHRIKDEDRTFEYRPAWEVEQEWDLENLKEEWPFSGSLADRARDRALKRLSWYQFDKKEG